MQQKQGSYTAMAARTSLAIRTLRNLRVPLITMFAVLISACSSDFSVEPTDARQMRFATESIHWGTPWHVTVTLPEGYDAASEGRYSLLLHFAFDQESYEWTREVVDEFNAGEGQHDVILASLDYVDGSVEVGDEQASENANKTLAHIEDAVLPFLREKYRIDRNVIFAGWSRFGRFSTYAVARKPELFDATIIRSSAPDDSDLHDRVREMLESKPQLELFVYHAIGTEGNEADRRPIFERFKQVLQSAAPTGVRWKSEVIEGADHVDTFSLGLRSGLSAYFEASEQLLDQDGEP